MEDLEKFLKNLGVGQRPLDDPFLENSFKACKVFERKGVTVEDEEELCHKLMKEFPCNACNAVFQNLLDYELHYHDTHHFVCSQCKKWKPTSRLLEIHIQEAHDNFFKVLAEKQPMYQCFVSECEVKFQTPEDRTKHCRETHEFPKNYRFDEYARVKTVSANDSPMELDEIKPCKKKNIKYIHFGKNLKQKAFERGDFNMKPSVGVKINDSSTESNLSTKPATMFIPRQVQQKSYAKILTQNRQLQKNVLESESIMELGESLPST